VALGPGTRRPKDRGRESRPSGGQKSTPTIPGAKRVPYDGLDTLRRIPADRMQGAPPGRLAPPPKHPRRARSPAPPPSPAAPRPRPPFALRVSPPIAGWGRRGGAAPSCA
jgi:hypothetical protein